MIGRVLDLVRRLRSDRMLMNSAMLFGTSLAMAGFGALFWVLAARLHSAHTVGLAGSLVAASDTLALFAQLGLNIALVRTMPRSDRKSADVIASAGAVGLAAAVLATGFVLLLPITSPRLRDVLGHPAAALLFVVLVSSTALNVLSDNVFLAIDRVKSYMWLNGILLGLAKCALPFLLVSAGVLGLYGSVGGAALLCGAASMVVILRHLGRPVSLRPSEALLHARGFAGAGYLTFVLMLLPQMVLPLLVVNEQGPAAGAYFFVSMQIIILQNAVIMAVGSSMYAESERHPDHRIRAVKRGGVTMIVVALGGALVVIAAAPLLLHIFGGEYAERGTDTLRVLSLGVIGLGFNYWVAIRLRIAHRAGAMVGAQAVCTVLVLVLCWVAAPHGTVWVALTWGLGQLLGGAAGYVISRVVAPIRDEPAAPAHERADSPDAPDPAAHAG